MAAHSVLIEEFLDFLCKQRHASLHTEKSYRADLIQFEQFVIGQIGAADGDAPIAMEIGGDALLHSQPWRIQKFLDYLLGQNYKSSSMSRKLASLKTFCKFLMHRGLITVNPSSGIRGPRRQKSPRVRLDHQQLDRLLNTPGNASLLAVRDTAILNLLSSSGIRVRELVNLTIADLDLPGRKIRIVGQSFGTRLLPISDEAAVAVERYLSIRDAGLNSQAGYSQSVILNGKGQALSAKSIRRNIGKYLVMAGLPTSISANDLRRCFTSKMLSGGASFKTVEDLLGQRTAISRHDYRRESLISTQIPAALLAPAARSAAA